MTTIQEHAPFANLINVAIATSFEPHLYTVESVHHAPSD
jgi:hypothetical protein